MLGGAMGLALRGRRLPAAVLGGWGIFTIVDNLGWAREVLSDRGFSEEGYGGETGRAEVGRSRRA